MSRKVIYDYDYQNDSLFIYCIDKYEYEVSLELDNNVILDFDVNARPVAFEFLNASQVFKLGRSNLNNLQSININARITDETISLYVKLVAPVHNKEQVFDVNRVVSNLEGIPSLETELVTA